MGPGFCIWPHAGDIYLVCSSVCLSSRAGSTFLGIVSWGFPGGSVDKESTCNAGDAGLIPEVGSFPGEGHGNPLQYSGLENPKD